MFGKIRKLYDDSKYLVGSKLKKESDLLYYQAKRRLTLGLKGAIAVGENFVGKIRDDGRADLLEVGQPSGYFGVNCRIPQDPRTAFHYSAKTAPYPAFTYQATTSCGYSAAANYTGSARVYPVSSPPMYQGYVVETFASGHYIDIGGGISKRHIDFTTTLVFDDGTTHTSTSSIESISGSPHTSDRYQDPFLYQYNNNWINIHRPTYSGIFDGYYRWGGLKATNYAKYVQVASSKAYISTRSGTIKVSENDDGNESGWEDETTINTQGISVPENPNYTAWKICKESWDAQESARVLAYSQYISEKAAYLAEFDDRKIAQLNDGEVIYDGSQGQGYGNVYYPDDVTPTTPPEVTDTNTVTAQASFSDSGPTLISNSTPYAHVSKTWVVQSSLMPLRDYYGGPYSGSITGYALYSGVTEVHFVLFGSIPIFFGGGDVDGINLFCETYQTQYPTSDHASVMSAIRAAGFKAVSIYETSDFYTESHIKTRNHAASLNMGSVTAVSFAQGINSPVGSFSWQVNFTSSTLTITTIAYTKKEYTGYDNHVIRHRAWRNTKTDLIYSDLDAGIVPKNMAIAVMNGAPYSLCVGIGSRWDGYSVTQTSSTVGSGVGAVVTYTRKLFALKDDGFEVELLSGECAVETINTTGFNQYKYTFNNFIALKPIAITGYLNGNYNITYPENLPINPSDCNGEPYTVVSINGTYDTLASGVTNSQAQAYSTSKIALVPAPDLTDITFTDIDLTPLSDNDGIIPKDTLRYDIDADEDGVIEASEKSATSTKFWIGKGLSKGETVTVFPIEYISQDGACGMFPQSYDVARIVAIRIYAGYKFKYDGNGGFEFRTSFNTPTLDAYGNEIEPYTEHPYVGTALLGGSNVVVIANSTSFDDVLETRKKQNSSKPEDSTVSIIGQYEKDIDAGKITLKGLYEWCRQQL
jgi:hypothetical protein